MWNSMTSSEPVWVSLVAGPCGEPPMVSRSHVDQIKKEMEACCSEHPQCHVRLVGFDLITETQEMALLVQRPLVAMWPGPWYSALFLLIMRLGNGPWRPSTRRPRWRGWP